MADMTKFTTDASVITELTKLSEGVVPAVAVTDAETQRDFIISRNDFKVEQVTPPNKAKVYKPSFVSANVTLDNAASMIAYVNRFKNPDSVMFANIDASEIVCTIDYHGAPAAVGHPFAELTAHLATLDLDYSEEWARWTGANEQMMKHVDFASFLEENAYDVSSPPGADLLELVKDLQASEGVQFTSSIRMGDTASVSFQKDNDTTTKNNMKLPVSFDIAIPVYFGESPVSVTCLMRRKIVGSSLQLGFKMLRLEWTRQREFARITGAVEAATQITTVYGKRVK